MSRVHQPPDLGRQFAALAAKVEALSNVVRRGKPAPNFRDLRDADLTQVTDGQVPVYDTATGTWRPGSAGSDPATAFYRKGSLTVVDFASGGTLVPWDFEMYNYGGMFSNPWDPTEIWYDEGNTAAVIRVEVWVHYSNAALGLSNLEVQGLDVFTWPPADSKYCPTAGGQINLGASATGILDGNPIRVYLEHFDTVFSRSVSSVGLSLTHVRDA